MNKIDLFKCDLASPSKARRSIREKLNEAINAINQLADQSDTTSSNVEKLSEVVNKPPYPGEVVTVLIKATYKPVVAGHPENGCIGYYANQTITDIIASHAVGATFLLELATEDNGFIYVPLVAITTDTDGRETMLFDNDKATASIILESWVDTFSVIIK